MSGHTQSKAQICAMQKGGKGCWTACECCTAGTCGQEKTAKQ
jgi:hypothetical protein